MKSFFSLLVFFFLFSGSLFASSDIRKIFLLRHAEYENSRSNNPFLSKKGRERAKALVKYLEDEEIKHIVVSSLRRTQQTAEPLCYERSMAPEKITDFYKIYQFIQDYTGNVVVVGHSNTVPEVIERFGGEKPEIAHDDFSGLYLVTLEGGKFKSLEKKAYGHEL